jgi:hypothetical protein
MLMTEGGRGKHYTFRHSACGKSLVDNANKFRRELSVYMTSKIHFVINNSRRRHAMASVRFFLPDLEKRKIKDAHAGLQISNELHTHQIQNIMEFVLSGD